MSQLPQVSDYTGRIPAQHQAAPKFMATISFIAGFYVHLMGLFDNMEKAGGCFDIDTPCVGNQEDGVGELVGVSREIAEPITGVYFKWDGTDPTVGWDSGVWQPADQPTALVTLPDAQYLTVIRAKIAANSWDGTTPGAYAVWAILFPTLTLLIQDFQDMSFTIGLMGAPIDPLTQALLTQGYVPLRPEGVRVREYIVSTDTNPLFAWDVNTANMKGWDTGSWGKEVPGT